MNNLNFITKEQRLKLEQAQQLIFSVQKEISFSSIEEYTIIDTTLDTLKKAINYEKDYY